MKFTNWIKIGHNGLLKKIPNTDYFKVVQPFYWYIDYGNKKEIVTVVEWFKTDMGSLPRPLWLFFNPTKYIWFIAHDFLYSEFWVIYETNHAWVERPYTRKESDLILLEMLHLEGAWFIERYLIYLGVRVGWFLFFKK